MTRILLFMVLSDHVCGLSPLEQFQNNYTFLIESLLTSIVSGSVTSGSTKSLRASLFKKRKVRVKNEEMKK